MTPYGLRSLSIWLQSTFEVSLGPWRSREEADKASSTCLFDHQVCAIVRRDGEQVHLPRGLVGSFETAQMDHVQYMSKDDLEVWRRPARALSQVLMTKFSCFALAAADMKPVQPRVESGSVSV